MRKIVGFLIGVVLLSAQPAHLQERPVIRFDPAAEEAFKQGVAKFSERNFTAAREIFARLIGENRWHQRLTAALIMHAKCSYWLHDDDAVRQDVRELLTIHPRSRYAADAHLLMALIFYRQKEYYRSARQMLFARKTARSPELARRATRLAVILLRDYLTVDQLQQLITEDVGVDGQALIVLAEAQKKLNQRRPQAAEALIENFLEVHPDTRFADELRTFLRDKIQKVLNTNRVGVILPLTGNFAPEGRQIAAGLRFAEMELRRKRANGVNVEFDVRDSGGSMIRTIQQAQQLVDDPNVICLIGEMENIITAGLAGVAEAYETPLLTTAATDRGIASIGTHVYQISPDLEVQARAMARYAFFVDSLRTFVTLAPNDEYGQQMVDAFSEEIDHLGGEIITQRWYYGVPEKLGRQFKQIREIAFRRAFEDTMRPQLPNFTSLNRDSLWKDFLERFKAETNQDETIVEQSAAYPVTNIDGIFLPIYQEDIEYVARQLKYFNINAKILGGEYWFLSELEKKRTLRRYIDGATFVSGYYFDPKDFSYRNFRDRFRKAVGVTPERWALFGFDLANFVFSLLDHQKISRSDFLHRLAASAPFEGREGRIEFNPQTRVNHSVYILRIEGSKIVKLPFDDRQLSDLGREN